MSVPSGDGNHGDHHKSSCFPANAEILTPKGYYPISKFKAGDYVLSWDKATSRMVREKVTKLKAHPSARTWTIDFGAKRRLFRATPFHTLLTQRGWIRLGRLNQGDALLVVHPGVGLVEIQNVFASDEEPVFNLTTTGQHNFIVDGLVAHNFTMLRRTRELTHKLIIDWRYSERLGPRSNPAQGFA